MLWTILIWLVFGLVVGAVARLLIPGRQPMGILGTMALGIVGSFVGGFIGNLLFGGSLFALHATGFIGSVLGALVVLGIAVLIGRASRK